jgi:SAM-dependent methyltransferase
VSGRPCHDGGRAVDWGRTSGDYSRYRPEYPAGLWDRLAEHGVGLPGQRVLDLGTGVGFVALPLAARGCRVTGIDVSEAQVEEARRLAAERGLAAEFRVTAAEDLDFSADSFDVVTAGQCWHYFDRDRMIPLVRSVLRPGGRLVTCHFSWLPRADELAAETERLVLRHNPAWTGADWSGEIPEVPHWSRGSFRVAGRIVWDEPIAFTREKWRGRIRACRGAGAALPTDELRRLDAELAELLERRVGEGFTVLHRVDAHVLEPA